jgi:predicted GNAT superfamily acetyltransferase
VRALGPDGEPVLVAAADTLWCRVPTDIVALRGNDPRQATGWRACMRDIFTDAFNSGYTARAVTRAGWYRLDAGDQA